ncbi:MAG: bifunctional oligoribonuclease/PAP phosphatase NrnA [Saprospiraceae bacterium]|nr:bifunctional oligoribonuclease/PAP phosphatase NrnA [Saprospiraceae bacterium]
MDITDVKLWLEMPRELVIVSHRNPDGDAIGSSLGLSSFLKKKFHKVTVIYPSEYPRIFEYLDGIYEVLIYDLKPVEVKKAIEKAEGIFCLDFNGLDRVDKMGEFIQFSNAKKFLIDHHLDPEPFTDYEFIDTNASSTSELVYLWIKALNQQDKMDVKIGEALFTGIITDTGSFKYNTRPETFIVASELKQLGVNDYHLQDLIFNCLLSKHLRLLGHCLANRMEILEESGIGIIYLSRKDYIDFDIQRGDTEGIVNHMLYVKNIQIAAFVTEQPTIIKLSLRSKGDISVQEVATKYFNGGGHKNAAGGGVYASLQDVLNKLKKVLPLYIHKSTH